MRAHSCTSRFPRGRSRCAASRPGRSRGPTAGSSRPSGSTTSRAELRRRIAETDPLDPGVPPPSTPWADAVVPLLGLERRGSKLYQPGARRSSTTRRRSSSSPRSSSPATSPSRSNRALAGDLERAADSSSSATACDRPRRVRQRTRRSSSPSARRPARSRSRASAICSVARAGRRSSCWSASTPTG